MARRRRRSPSPRELVTLVSAPLLGARLRLRRGLGIRARPCACPVDYHSSTIDQVFALAIFAFIAAIAIGSIGSYLRRPHDLAQVRGSAVLGSSIRGWYFENLLPFEEFCVRWGISPTLLSYAQLAGSLLVGYCYAEGFLFTGGWLLLFTGTLDIIDGRVARRTNSGSARGAFLDSVIDRYADSFAYLGLAIFFRTSWVLWAVLFALLGGLMVSYARARAEGLGAQCHVGLLQRPERYVILGFGTIFGTLCEHLTGPWLPGQHYSLIVLTLVFLAAVVNFTAIQRVTYVWRVLGEDTGG
jgi:CDP-diacylglycerol--glycerol-3-phosphate 3-phosphatidyltransferase